MKPCCNPNCKNLTSNPYFCSRSCSACVSNTTAPKRIKKITHCQVCGKKLEIIRPYKRRTRCVPNCLHNYRNWDDVLLGEVTENKRYQIHSQVRQLARRVYMNSSKPKECILCGYSKHFDVCHIKAIKDFPLDTKLQVVNDLENLVSLCKNHHWEFDNGMLTLSS